MSDLRKPEIAAASPAERQARRERLREAVGQLATAIAAGAIRRDAHELEALAQLCVDHFLPVEANRIRRWIPQAGREGDQPGSG